jgi:RimJ/RimL family protein N-acetyltransferase
VAGKNEHVAHVERFETARLMVRPLEPSDIEAAFDVYASNPDYLELTEGTAGEPGRYDRTMFERDFAIVQMTPGRQLSAVCLNETGELLGGLDWMLENPADGYPWLGLLIIRADRQRQGFGREALEALAAQLRTSGMAALRAGVIERNRPGRAFAEELGFQSVETTTQRMASEENVIVCERAL